MIILYVLPVDTFSVHVTCYVWYWGATCTGIFDVAMTVTARICNIEIRFTVVLQYTIR
jgi:hypothetical protein